MLLQAREKTGMWLSFIKKKANNQQCRDSPGEAAGAQHYGT